jgi:hypothetical protein
VYCRYAITKALGQEICKVVSENAPIHVLANLYWNLGLPAAPAEPSAPEGAPAPAVSGLLVPACLPARWLTDCLMLPRSIVGFTAVSLLSVYNHNLICMCGFALRRSLV